MLRLRIAPAVLLLSTLGALQAQQTQSSTPLTTVPRLVRISNTFHPANGQPAAPVEGVTLSIYREQHDGTPLWQETQNVSIEADGHYSVLLGSTLNEGMPLELFTSGEPRWLGVQFNRAGEIEQPRVQLVSVPFALKASDADTLGGRPASAYMLSPTAVPEKGRTGSEGSTTTAASAMKAASVGVSALADNFYGQSSFVVSDTTGALTGISVQNTAGGTSSYSGMLFYDQNGALGQFQGFNNSTHEYRINNIATGGSINFMLGSSSKFYLANSGNIGIGTTAPGSKLDVAGDINTSGTLRKSGTIIMRTAGTNAALGALALQSNTSGAYNTAIGYNAGTSTTGNWNTNIGYYAGYNDTNGGDNIRINNDGVAGESNTARIGGSYIYRTFIAGIRGVTTGVNNAIPVYIDSAGQLGTISSSRRVKRDIEDMGDTTDTIMALHPVRFRYKAHGENGPEQYGLIAEEVAEVAPELATRTQDGAIETVYYDKVNAMLLNQVQTQQRILESQKAQLEAQTDLIHKLESRLTEIEGRLK